jgi:hypothetical protein
MDYHETGGGGGGGGAALRRAHLATAFSGK